MAIPGSPQAAIHAEDRAVDDEEFYFMANLAPEDTGLPMYVWISERGRARHAARVKVAPRHSKMCPPDELVSVSIDEPIEVKAGTDLRPRDLRLVTQWIQRNRETLRLYGNNEISTREGLTRLCSLI